MARIARCLFDREPVTVAFLLMDSFAKTYRVHGTDRALVAGMLGFVPDEMMGGCHSP